MRRITLSLDEMLEGRYPTDGQEILGAASRSRPAPCCVLNGPPIAAHAQSHSYGMRLARLTITNFRNLDGVDIPLVGGPVIVGENRVGKSNLVHAIRLVLDSSLSNKARWLRTEDFSEHLGLDPIADGAEIRISVEIEDFGEDGGLMAALRHAIVSGDPVRARITYRFGPGELEELEDGDEAFSPDAYQWSIYGREDENPRRIPAELRARLHHEYLGALRDVEGDLRSWWRSPLRDLLEQAARDADPQELQHVREALEEANIAVSDLGSVKDLADRVGKETARLGRVSFPG